MMTEYFQNYGPKNNPQNSILKRISYLTFGRGAAVLANIISLMVAARFLTLNDFATFKQTFLPYTILVPILQLGIPNTIYYLLPRRKDKLNLVLESSLILTFSAFVFCVFFLLGGSRFFATRFHNPNLNESFKWLIPYTIFQLPVNLFISVLVYEGKTKIVAIYSMLINILLAISIIFLAIKFGSYKYLVITKSLIPVVGTLILFYIISRHLVKSFSKEKNMLRNMESIIKISLPLGLAGMIGTISMQLDKIFVSSFFSPRIFAIYVNGAFEIPFIGVLTGSIGAVILAELSESIKNKDIKRSADIFSRTATKTALFLFPLMVFLMLTAKDFIILMFSSKYLLSVTPFRIYLLLIPIRIVVFGSALIALGKNKIILKRSIIELILNSILSYILLKLLGYNGVAIATVIVVFLWSVPYNIYEISKGFKIRFNKLFNYKELFKILMISIIVSPLILVSMYIKSSILLRFSFSFLIYFPLVFLLFKKYNLIGRFKWQ